jgi:polyisoprenoid-binding protein YceI
MQLSVIMEIPREETGISHGAAEDREGPPERWEIDQARSTLKFKLRHMVVQRIQGRFQRWGGSVFIDRAQPWRSSVDVWVDLSSITTDDADRDAHVRSAEFLDVRRFPRAEYKSSAVDLREGHVFIEGRLDLHGVINDVRVCAGHITLAADDQTRVVYKALVTVDRQSFGLRWNQDVDAGGVVVGDEVQVEAEIELVRVDRH